VLVRRALELADEGDFRMACHLVELAARADGDHLGAQRARADVYERRRQDERSLMAKGIYGWASRESQAAADQLGA
jgi:alkyl sulfatase BDS1-like metallo-beta-lactamase superfamily hydrolase